MKTFSRATKKVSGIATVINTGHACIGTMGWESPFIVFQLNSTLTVRWHSDNVETLAKAFGFPCIHDMQGRSVKIEANARLAKRQFADGIERFQVQKMIALVDM